MTKQDNRQPNPNPGAMVVLPEGSPDIIMFRPYSYVVAGADNAKFLATQNPYSQVGLAYQTKAPAVEKIIQSKIDLSAVTIVGYTPNYNNNILTYSAILKIDIATSPTGTSGVEARTYVRGS